MLCLFAVLRKIFHTDLHYYYIFLEENPSHPSSTASSLSLIHEVELVDELNQIVATLVNRSHQSHQSHVVTLSIKLWFEFLTGFQNW